MGQQQGLQKFYAPTLQLGPNRRHHDQADSQTGFSTGRWYTVVELFLTLSKTLILALILILGGNQKHIYLRLKSIFKSKFECWWLILIISANKFYSARKTQYKIFMSQLEPEWSKGAKKGINFNQRTGSLLHLVQSLKASLKTRSPSLCVKGPTVRVQLEDFQLVLDDFVQAFFSPKASRQCQFFRVLVLKPVVGWLAQTLSTCFKKPFQRCYWF